MADTLRRVKTRFIRQDEKGIRKEWYRAADGDLLIRRGLSTGDITGFELAFDRPDSAHQDYVNWTKGRATRTGLVDPGERTGRAKMSPLIALHDVADPRVLKRAAAYVADRRRRLPQELRIFLAGLLGRPGA
jgi:hypothetical protein